MSGPFVDCHAMLGMVVLSVIIPTGWADEGPGPTPGSFAALKGELHKATEEAIGRRDRARTDAERQAATAAMWDELKSVARRAIAWADAHPGDPEAVGAVAWTLLGHFNGYYPECAAETARAFDWLRERGLGSEKIVPLCASVGDQIALCPEALRFYESALSGSPNRAVRGSACLGLARGYRALATSILRVRDPITRKPIADGVGARMPEYLQKLETSDPDDAERKAKSYFQRVIAEFADLKLPYPFIESPFAELARGELDAMEQLSVGKLAPDLVGEDMAGRPLRLADFRGKVVALVFWATWCGPCMGMVPDERALVKRHEGKPFVLIGVNGDDDRAEARETMARESMTWPSFWNDGKIGGIVSAWAVRSWPTVYVLDSKGVIRYQNVRGESLDRAVDKLIAELEGPSR